MSSTLANNIQLTREGISQVVASEIKLNSAFIDGEWVDLGVSTEEEAALYDPNSGDVIAQTALCSADHVDLAAQAASAALAPWSQTTGAQRASYLNALADAMQQQFDTLVGLSVLNNGKPIAEAQIDVSDAIACYRYYAKLAAAQLAQTTVATNEPGIRLYKSLEPIGVCALIVPWNFPMVTTAWKLAPALAAGCTVLLKPSEVTLLPELMLGNILSNLSNMGFPKGVVNILPGAAAVGAAMTRHPLIDKVSFTGSNGVGEKVMAQAAIGAKDISLELGGKSAIIVRADADIDAACELIIGGIFTNAGQICSATSRLIVHQDIAQALYQQLKAKTMQLTIGDGFAEATQMGPLVSAAQLSQVRKYFAIAKDEQLECLVGGENSGDNNHSEASLPDSGYFVAPTIYTDVPTSSRLWQEEIFGPVLVTTTYQHDDEAIQLANDSNYALAATLVSADEEKALAMAARVRAGHIWINEQQIVLPEAGWGGFKQSGIGRELGEDGLAAYQKSKHILLPA
ncbi:aldehyde dehydrogenase family protein [Psychrobacter pygoscelis]|uniref:aldehyde dehydrogenase family protein n=1 Tax=Psychrobacter pygoscelis TaxID=2488563 RepID=UPI00103CE4CE|nr:aldehyde dehydrogenase family protein [Psychrobacter pygoscelis]